MAYFSKIYSSDLPHRAKAVYMLSCDWYYRKGIKPITENCRAGDSGSGKGWAYKKGTEVA